MPWPFSRVNSRYALVGDRHKALLAMRNSSPAGTATVTPLAWTNSPLSEPKSVHQLMNHLPTPKGQVALSLPLEEFEMLTLTINKVPKEAIAKILPFHIGKVLDEPLTNFIYDWQIIKELKDSLQLTVFLFPALRFNDLRTLLGQYRLNVTTLEPDIFSACACLEAQSQLQTGEAAMIALLWSDSISIAIHDKENLLLTRSILIAKPERACPAEPPHQDDRKDGEAAGQPAQPLETKDPFSLFEPNPDGLLADFLVATRIDKDDHDGPDHDESPVAQSEKPVAAGRAMPSYSSLLSLELMRTRDYYNSVIKGNQIKSVFIGGGEDIWPLLSSELKTSLGLQINNLMAPDRVTNGGDPLFEAVSLGVLS